MVRFREEQRFARSWVYAILLAALLLPVALQLPQLAGRPDVPALLLAIVVPALLLLWFSRLCLVTEVRDDGLVVQFRWLWRPRRFRWGSIRRAEPRTYRPIREYGGWGIRFGPRGRAYNVSGDRGVQLELADGSRVLIGSRRADELAAAIAEARRRAL